MILLELFSSLEINSVNKMVFLFGGLCSHLFRYLNSGLDDLETGFGGKRTGGVRKVGFKS